MCEKCAVFPFYILHIVKLRDLKNNFYFSYIYLFLPADLPKQQQVRSPQNRNPSQLMKNPHQGKFINEIVIMINHNF